MVTRARRRPPRPPSRKASGHGSHGWRGVRVRAEPQSAGEPYVSRVETHVRRIEIGRVSPNRERRLHRMRRTTTKQLSLELRTHGGARRGAGRKPKGSKAGVAHVARGALGGAIPILVTMKVLAGIANLRSRRRFERVLASLQKACGRFETRIVEFSVQDDHVHLVVESRDARALSRAMKGLAVRLARVLNRSLGRRGKVFADRFHHRCLTTPRQVRNALQYVLCNAKKHRVAPSVRGWLDPMSSAPSFDGWIGEARTGPRATASPRTWLLRIGWRRGGLLHPDHTPGPTT